MRIVGIFALVVIAAGFLLRRVESSSPQALDLWFLDVGQGDAAFVHLPDGTRWLVDAGGKIGRRDRGSVDVVPELTRRGATTIDAAILSHPDQDHGYGFRGVLAELAVRELWISATSPQTKPLLRELKQLAGRRATAVRLWAESARWRQGGVDVEVIPVGAGEATNDRELLVALEWAGCRIFFAGDIEREVERTVARDPRRVDLLKVPHHGSRTSSTESLLAAWRPRWAIVSVGAGNRYGHPNADVLARYRRHTTTVLRTDLHGFLHFRIAETGAVQCDSATGACGESRCGR